MPASFAGGVALNSMGRASSPFLHAFDENGAIARAFEPVLRDFLIFGTVVPGTRFRSGRKLNDHDTLWRFALQNLLRSIGSENLDGMAFESGADLALIAEMTPSGPLPTLPYQIDGTLDLALVRIAFVDHRNRNAMSAEYYVDIGRVTELR